MSFKKELLRARLPIAVFLLTVACLYGFINSSKHSEAYSFITYMSALARAVTLDVYIDSPETALQSVEEAFRKKDRYFKTLYTTSDFDQMFASITGSNAKKYGFFFSSKDGTIKTVLKHSPNFGKIKKGDTLKSVNGVTDPSKFLEELTSNDTVDVVVQREDQLLHFTLQTAAIEPMYCNIEGTSAEITIYFFRMSMIEKFKACIDKIANSKVESITFDVSQSPGGAVRALTATLAMVTPKGKLMFYEKRKTKTIKYYAREESVLDLKNYQVTVLKSSRTASSAEIFAASLKYNYPHVELKGDKTYGKWSTIQIVPFLKGGVVLSVGKIYLPDGSTYEGEGI